MDGAARPWDAETLARFGGDAELLREVVGVLRAQIPTALGALRAAASTGDAEALQRAAHKLRGSVGVFGPSGAADTAAAIDRAAADGDLAAAARELDVLERRLADLTAALEQLAASLPAAADPPVE